MTVFYLLGFSASILIGVSLGLIGGGGSILTLPVLVYLLGVDPVAATGYSLFVVGTTSMVGAVSYMRQQQVNYKAAVFFAVPSFLAVFLTRKYLVPAIPDPFFAVGPLLMSKSMAIMLFFALLMLVAAFSMIRDRKNTVGTALPTLRFNIPLIAAEGLLVGTITGVVGAGGGFLIIPALVLLVRLPMKMAVGTSLLIIAVKSLVGFLGDLSTLAVNWSFLLGFTAFAVLGIFGGTYLARYVPGERLKTTFGWFVLLMGIYIIGRELITSPAFH